MSWFVAAANTSALSQNISQQFNTAFGSPLLVGLIVLVALAVIGIKHGLDGGAMIVILLPLVLAMAFGGYLPRPLAFVALALAGFLTYYVIRELIGGGYK